MRYLVTGAAGFIGSHLARRAPRRGPRRRRRRLLHRLLRPGAEGGERRGPRRPPARPRRRRARPRPASTASSTSRASRACAASATSSRDYLRRNLLATQRLFEAAAAAGVRVVFARPRSIYGDAERYPTPEDDRAAADLAVRDHEARLRAPRPRVRAELRARRGRASATSRCTARASGRTWSFTRIVEALAEGGRSSSTATASSRAASRTSATPWRRRSCAAAAPAGRSTTSAAARRRRCCEAIALLERISGRTLEVRAGAAAAGDVARTKADVDPDPRRPRLGAATGAGGRLAGSVGMGLR